MSRKKITALDYETTKAPHLHPWDAKAFVVAGGIKSYDRLQTWVFEHRHSDNWDTIDALRSEVESTDILVAHNLKFELNWCNHLRITVPLRTKLFCTQVAEYMINRQARIPYDLDTVSERRGLPGKIPLIKSYWESGVDTYDIPLVQLIPYLEQDCINTYALYEIQAKLLTDMGLMPAFQVQMEMLRMLSAIEYNGVKFDAPLAQSFAEDYNAQIDVLDAELKEIIGYEINFGSNQQLSAALYGGEITEKVRETYEFEYKDGRVATKERWGTKTVTLPGLGFKPGKNSEKSQEGVFSVDKNTLQALTARNQKQRTFLDKMLRRSMLAKAVSTYFEGLQEVNHQGFIHPSLNQTVTRTGRLSSSNPKFPLGL